MSRFTVRTNPSSLLKTTHMPDSLFLRGHHYRALKVYIRTSDEIKELVIHKHLSKIKTSHPGKQDIRFVLDAFEVSSPGGHRHTCLIHEPLATSLHELMGAFPDRSLPEELLKTALRQVLIALHFLHSEARLIHTGSFNDPGCLWESLYSSTGIKISSI